MGSIPCGEIFISLSFSISFNFYRHFLVLFFFVFVYVCMYVCTDVHVCESFCKVIILLLSVYKSWAVNLTLHSHDGKPLKITIIYNQIEERSSQLVHNNFKQLRKESLKKILA